MLEFWEESWGITKEKMKFKDLGWNINSDSITLFQNWHWFTKVWVAKRIRYPSSPHPEFWMLNLFKLMILHSASIVLWQRWNGIDLAGLDISSGACGLIGWYPLNLTCSSWCCMAVVSWFSDDLLTSDLPLSITDYFKHSRPHVQGYTHATMVIFNQLILTLSSDNIL